MPVCMAQREANDRKRGKDPLRYEYVEVNRSSQYLNCYLVGSSVVSFFALCLPFFSGIVCHINNYILFIPVCLLLFV